MQIETLRDAAAEIVQTLMNGYHDERGVHAETIIGGAAALAGEYALRAVIDDLPPAGWIIGGAADELLFSGEESNKITLWSFLKMSAKDAGVSAHELPDIREIVLRVANAVGTSPFPPLTIAPSHYPREWSPEACPRFRHDVDRIAAKYELSRTETAVALSVVIMMLINQTKHMVSPHVLVRLAAEIMIGVSRMAPLPDAGQSPQVH